MTPNAVPYACSLKRSEVVSRASRAANYIFDWLIAYRSGERARVAHRQDADLAALRDPPLALALVQNPLGPMVTHPDVALPVVLPHLDRDRDDLARHGLDPGRVGGRGPAGGLDAVEPLAEVDGSRARSKEEGGSGDDVGVEGRGRGQRGEGEVLGRGWGGAQDREQLGSNPERRE